jgi:hypothetical protein
VKHFKNIFLVLTSLSFFLCSQHAFAQTLDNALAASAASAKKKNISGFLMAQHYAGFGDQRNEPATFLFGQINYQIDKWILFANQSANKVYYIADSNEPELIFADTQFGVLRVFKDILKGNLQVRGFLTLPVSELSQRNGLITRPDFRFRNTWFFMDRKLSFSAGAELMLYMNRYTTTYTGPGDEGMGAPLPLFRTSFQTLLSYSLNDSLSVSSYAFYIDRQFESLGPSTPNGNGTSSNHDVWAGISVNYSFDNNWVGTVSYDHSNTLEQNGNVDFYAFDAVSSQWSIGVNYIF